MASTGSISTLGIGSGLDLNGILDQLKAVDQKPIDKKTAAVTAANSQISEFTTVNNKLLTLKSAALDLSLSGTFIGRTVTSSLESAVTATVTDGATIKNSTVSVKNLAQKSSWMSASGVAKTDSDSISTSDATFSIQIGDKISAVAITAGITMGQLVDKINSASDNPGVTATIINDGVDSTKPYKMVLTANNPGETNRITLSGLPDGVMTEQTGQTVPNSLNAQFTVDGVSYQRQSNTIEDVLSGVTLNFQDIGNSTLTVSSNNSELQDKITSLVTAYNDVVQEVKGQSGYDTTTKTFGLLANTTLRDMPFDLEGLMTSTNTADPSGAIKSLFDLGLTFNKDGTITIDPTTLSAAISNHSDGVQAFFLGDPTNNITGLADMVNNRLRTMTSDSGSIKGDINGAQARIDGLNSQITDDTARLNKKYDLMTSQFVALDTYMSKMTSMSNFLTGQFNSLSNGWSGTGSSSNSSG